MDDIVKRPASLRARIRADIESRILSGEWLPGYRIPFEHELMEQYGCARMTVSGALASLAEAGFIERRRRAGSFVRRPPARTAVVEIPDIKAEVLGRGEVYGYELLVSQTRKATVGDRKRLHVPAGATVLALQARHHAAGQPFAYEDRLIPLDAVPEAREAEFGVEPPGTWLLRHVPWQEAENIISARSADAEIAAQLAIAEGTACLVIDRTTWRSKRTLTSVRLWHPGERQRLVARFTP
ncbi:MAG TPA: histidine utilization repressor [Saliniramus sp.]|nr:histidine utilization repressor [Saliniramus sp.]